MKKKNVSYILESLRQLLCNTRIETMILKEPSLCSSGVFYDISDGTLYTNDAYYKERKDALILLLYHDELKICNPLGANAGIHKVDMFYYSLGNLNPKFRSKHVIVNLTTCKYTSGKNHLYYVLNIFMMIIVTKLRKPQMKWL